MWQVKQPTYKQSQVCLIGKIAQTIIMVLFLERLSTLDMLSCVPNNHKYTMENTYV